VAVAGRARESEQRERGRELVAAGAEAAAASWATRWAAAFNAAGGLFWHLDAWRNADGRWAGTKARIGGWLDAWRPSERALLLVGPSAGWMLERRLLARFDDVLAVDPDPLAAWLFRRRFPSISARFVTTDYLGPRTDALRLDRLDALFDDHPGCAVLFCNVLSQLAALYPEATGAVADPPEDSGQFAAWKARLRERLGERSWASFHDRLSSSRPLHQDVIALEHDLPSAELAERCYDLAEGERLEVYDHQLAGLHAAMPRHLIDWPRRRGLHHVVELLSAAR
jgi:hypothetical protein